MANSPESDLVEEALNKALPMLDGYDENDILVDWVVVAYVDSTSPDGVSGYPMLFSNGDMPGYKARGLLRTGLTKLEIMLSEE